MIRMIRKPELEKTLGRKNTALYSDIKQGLLTESVRIGSKSVAWPEHEIDAITRARIAGKTDDEVRTLVSQLHAARKVAQ